MVSFYISVAALVLVFLIVVVGRNSTGRPGPGAAGAVYDLLNEDKRRAIEIVVEQRAADTGPATRDGTLPKYPLPKYTSNPERQPPVEQSE